MKKVFVTILIVLLVFLMVAATLAPAFAQESDAVTSGGEVQKSGTVTKRYGIVFVVWMGITILLVIIYNAIWGGRK